MENNAECTGTRGCIAVLSADSTGAAGVEHDAKAGLEEGVVRAPPRLICRFDHFGCQPLPGLLLSIHVQGFRRAHKPCFTVA